MLSLNDAPLNAGRGNACVAPTTSTTIHERLSGGTPLTLQHEEYPRTMHMFKPNLSDTVDIAVAHPFRLALQGLGSTPHSPPFHYPQQYVWCGVNDVLSFAPSQGIRRMVSRAHHEWNAACGLRGTECQLVARGSSLRTSGHNDHLTAVGMAAHGLEARATVSSHAAARQRRRRLWRT